MRLIDADELKMYLIQANEWQEIITTDDVLEIIERQTVVDTSKNLLCTIRVNMDTEEVLGLLKERGWGPVEQGRWERHYSRPNVFADSYWHCSECGYKTANQWANRYYKYCPNCGAYMMEDYKNG